MTTAHDRAFFAPLDAIHAEEALQERIDVYLSDQFNRACRVKAQYVFDADTAPYLHKNAATLDDVCEVICDDKADWLGQIVQAAVGKHADTVEGVVGKMLDAARERWVTDEKRRRAMRAELAERDADSFDYAHEDR